MLLSTYLRYFTLRLLCKIIYTAIDAPSLPQVDGIAPTFSTKPTIRQGPDGTTLIFHCAIVADPKPQITWFHDGVKVADGGKFQVRENASHYIMIVLRVVFKCSNI